MGPGAVWALSPYALLTIPYALWRRRDPIDFGFLGLGQGCVRDVAARKPGKWKNTIQYHTLWPATKTGEWVQYARKVEKHNVISYIMACGKGVCKGPICEENGKTQCNIIHYGLPRGLRNESNKGGKWKRPRKSKQKH